jgi:hypothetical protein
MDPAPLLVAATLGPLSISESKGTTLVGSAFTNAMQGFLLNPDSFCRKVGLGKSSSKAIYLSIV